MKLKKKNSSEARADELLPLAEKSQLMELWSLVGCSCPADDPVPVASTDWTQLVIKYKEGMKLGRDVGCNLGRVGVRLDVIKIYCVHIRNSQRIHLKYKKVNMMRRVPNPQKN